LGNIAARLRYPLRARDLGGRLEELTRPDPHGFATCGPVGKSWNSNRMDEKTIDRTAMGRLAKALAFICGPDHPTTVALRVAAESGSERDIKNARALFLRLKPSDRRAALTMLDD